MEGEGAAVATGLGAPDCLPAGVSGGRVGFGGGGGDAGRSPGDLRPGARAVLDVNGGGGGGGGGIEAEAVKFVGDVVGTRLHRHCGGGDGQKRIER